jgi:hypothetical protein
LFKIVSKIYKLLNQFYQSARNYSDPLAKGSPGTENPARL